MPRHLAFPIFAALAIAPACTTHRLAPLPPEHDPADPRAPIVPYRAPPDVLTTELSKGDPDAGTHHHHDHAAAPKPTPEPAADHDHGGGR